MAVFFKHSSVSLFPHVILFVSPECDHLHILDKKFPFSNSFFFVYNCYSEMFCGRLFVAFVLDQFVRSGLPLFHVLLINSLVKIMWNFLEPSKYFYWIYLRYFVLSEAATCLNEMIHFKHNLFLRNLDNQALVNVVRLAYVFSHINI